LTPRDRDRHGPSRVSDPHGQSQGPGVVVLHDSPASAGLIEALTRTMARVGLTRITCVRDGTEPSSTRTLAGIEIHTISVEVAPGSDAHVEVLRREVTIVEAHAVIVLPRSDSDEPDSSSRMTCVAIRQACAGRLGPNVLVEIEDPEAAFEFAGLGVATVFYPGHLRAALLGQACVDLGVFQFVVGLLRGRHHVRSIPVPDELRDKRFADAALSLECDADGRAMTVIGVARKFGDTGQASDVVVNPGPNTLLRDVVCLLTLVSGEPEPERVRGLA
jgi:hypothetical protein